MGKGKGGRTGQGERGEVDSHTAKSMFQILGGNYT